MGVTIIIGWRVGSVVKSTDHTDRGAGFPVPIWQLTTISNSSSRGSDVLLGTMHPPDLHIVHGDRCRRNTIHIQ